MILELRGVRIRSVRGARRQRFRPYSTVLNGTRVGHQRQDLRDRLFARTVPLDSHNEHSEILALDARRHVLLDLIHAAQAASAGRSDVNDDATLPVAALKSALSALACSSSTT